LHIFTDNLSAAKMIKIYQRVIICTKMVYEKKTKICYCKRTMTQNIGVIFVLRGNKKMTLTKLVVAIARCKSHRKCLGTHEVQALREEALDH